MNAHPSLTGQVNVREINGFPFFPPFVFIFTTTHLPIFTVENHVSGSSTGLKQYQPENLDLIAFYFCLHFIQSFKLTAVAGPIEISAEVISSLAQPPSKEGRDLGSKSRGQGLFVIMQVSGRVENGTLVS